MKKLSLILGALLAVGTVVQAKEQVIVAPMVEEIIIAEPVVEQIVLHDNTFRPSGYVGLEYKTYGKTENHGDSLNPQTLGFEDDWNSGENNYSRLQTTFGVQATENFKLEGRIRDYNDLEKNDGTKGNAKNGTDTRLRGYYKHNDTFTSRVEYRDTEKNEERYEYQLRYNAYTNKDGLVDRVILAPKIGRREKSNHTNYFTRLGADAYLTGNLPLGLTWENNYYLNYDMHNSDIKGLANNKKKDKEFNLEVELYLRRSFALYATEKSNLNLDLEIGYDPYKFNQYKRILDINADGIVSTYKRAYELRSLVDLGYTYSLTENVAIKTGIGAEYRNWDVTAESRAKDWRWQPFAYAAMNIKF